MLRRASALHETSPLVALHICSHELGRCGGSLLLRYGKEGRLVEEQVLTHTQEVDQEELQIEVINDLGRFNSIAAEWDRLVDRSNVERLFVSHAWLRTWWEAFAGDKELHILAIRKRGELVGAAPMMRSRQCMYGLRIHSVESIYNHHTPRFDFIIAAGANETVYRTLWNHICHGDDCETVVLRQVPDNSPTLPAFERLARADGWLSGQWIAPPSPYIPLNCTYEEFLETLRSGHKYNLRKRYERLSKAGTIDVEVVTEKQHVREVMHDGLRIEAAAWKGNKGTAIISDAAVTEFYMRLAEREADLGQLRLSFLRVGGKRISFNFALCSQGKLYGVKIGYDPEYHAYSPGNMLLNLILQDACGRELSEYDFLGIDDEWKSEWTNAKRGHRWLFLFRDRGRARLLHYLKFSVVPVVKPQLGRLCTYLRGQV